MSNHLSTLRELAERVRARHSDGDTADQLIQWANRFDAADRLDKIERLVETGTAQSFAALSDDDKLRWFAITGQRDKWARERLEALRAENKRLLGLLKAASCPACDGSGAVPHGPTPDGVWEGRQCQWCDERNHALATGGE